MKLIVGLGNPGKEYENTRHNIGFMVLDNYLYNANWQKKFKGLYTYISINNEKVYFLKPETYMNLSGEAVREIVNFFKIKPENILVIHDDLDLEFGKIRIKQNSSDGGHNGIKSIINNLGTKNFVRLKVGISHNKNYDTKNYVLGHFSASEEEKLQKLYPIFNDIIEDFIKGTNLSKLMNNYNGNLENLQKNIQNNE